MIFYFNFDHCRYATMRTGYQSIQLQKVCQVFHGLCYPLTKSIHSVGYFLSKAGYAFFQLRKELSDALTDRLYGILWGRLV